MTFRTHFLENYLSEAPAALAIERWLECEILSRHRFEAPILDLGCGDGIFASVLFSAPLDLGVDPDAHEIGKAEKRRCYRELLVRAGHDIPKPTGSFQTILSNSVLEHIQEIGPVLREARRLLAPEGRFYVTIPSHNFDRYSAGSRLLRALGLTEVDSWFRRSYNSFWKHHHAYRPEEWRSLFLSHGFQVESYQEYGSKTVCTLNDLLVPAAFFSLLAKKFTGRWFFCPQLRRLYAPALARVIGPWYRLDPHLQNGGLLFFALVPSDNSAAPPLSR